jgi:pyrroloquinoline quinone biosynthesis protein E
MSDEPRLYTLIAELTYRCPLRCPYCSNPLDYKQRTGELTTEEWQRVLGEAEALGALQVTFTGGEPLIRTDLEALVARAHALALYSTLITSAVPLRRERLEALARAGLNAVQISVQSVEAAESDRLAGTECFDQKLNAARWVKELGLPLTLNVVLHRQNLGRVVEIVALAEDLAVDRLELANTQYLGWALPNRDALLPAEEQLREARRVATEAKARLKGTMEVLFVLPDYYSDRPKACMNGWGQRYLLVAPDGLAQPCHLAHTIPGLTFDDVRTRSLEEIWTRSPAFLAFRGEGWMSETCRACPKRAEDYGGCRCQAFHLTGDARATDPTCSLSPHHALVRSARDRATPSARERLIPLRYRGAREP